MGEEMAIADNRYLRWFIAVWSVAFIAFHVYTAAFGVFIAQFQRPVYLLFAFVFGFLVVPVVKGS
jgi:hypothetical protein